MKLPSQSSRDVCSVCSKPIDVHHMIRGGTCGSVSCRSTAAKRVIAQQRATQQAVFDEVARRHMSALLASAQLTQDQVAVVTLAGRNAQLQPPAPERRESFRAHLAGIFATTPAADSREVAADELRDCSEAAPSSIPAAACGTCRGWCCRGGGDTAYIDDITVRRIRAQHPDLGDAELIALYTDAIPGRSVEGSCILHGEQGCALPRELRSGICNRYYCQPLHQWLRDVAGGEKRATAIVVLEEDKVIRSTLVPSASMTALDDP